MSALAVQSSSALEVRDPAPKTDEPKAAPKQFKKDLAKAKSAKPATDGQPTPDGGAEAVKPDDPTTIARGSQQAIDVSALTAATTKPGGEKPAIATGPQAPAQPAPAAPAQAAADVSAAELPALTPLEQAVHDLIDQIGKRDDKADDKLPLHAALGSDPTALVQPAAHLDAPDPHAKTHAAQVSPLQQLSDVDATAQQQAQSHVHLVIDDGDARIVMTVAVRGHDVHVSTRSSDDGTAAAIARNAHGLDHALRARGLDLAELAQQSEPDESRRERRHEQRERKATQQPKFSLEEQS